MVLTWEQRFADINAMRARFAAVIDDLVTEDPRVAAVFADITWDKLPESARSHPRFVNVGIREQLMIDVAGGLAMAGLRPIAHTFASFLVERPFEQIKIGLNHQDVGAVLVSAGASYDLAVDGRTHEAPGDVALLSTLPDWTISVPGHADEAEAMLRAAAGRSDLEYIRLSTDTNAKAYWRGEDGFTVLRRGREGTVVAVGPLADPVLAATAGMDVTVLYAPRVRPFDRETLRKTLSSPDVALVEPYLTGTSAAEVGAALEDVPHRLLSIGVPAKELRRYGTPQEHAAAYGLDAKGLRERLARFF
ncbi:transketolase family protein [Amycolatopsis australiensis]|uniref:Transketolase n=1 Tax=Amycolatopsis australiensis TaxID=546364 RepID=A0A1K1RFH9_9PSEU|nr:transketolase [Amycolatopsis australiensis]SFW70705.1 transketolase [Amycolatopsis australiensis]